MTTSPPPTKTGMTNSQDRPAAKDKRMKTNSSPSDVTATAAVNLRSSSRSNHCRQSELPACDRRRTATGARTASPRNGKVVPTANISS